MHVDLFTVSGSSLERNWERVTVHQDFALNLSISLSSSQDIHQCGLSGTRRAHHGGEGTSFAVSENIVE
jgi:hypothetical protein